jgi:DNA (cytosine-5)-methyltransferase 1
MIDLFAGTGAFTHAFQSTGKVECVFANDMVSSSKEIYDLNFNHELTLQDLNNVKVTDIPAHDLLTGGFPCQPFSVAGKRAGTEDNRYLWPELLRVIRLVKPTWCILENVRGLLSIEDGLVFENCLLDLEAAGYEHQTLVIPACAVNAHHRRDRVWVLAHAVNSPDRTIHQQAGEKDGIQGKHWEAGRSWMPCGTGSDKKDVAYSSSPRREELNPATITNRSGHRSGSYAQRGSVRPTQSRLGRKFNGISAWLDELGLPKVSSDVPKRFDRLKQLGNSVVPQIPYLIGCAILEAESQQWSNAL